MTCKHLVAYVHPFDTLGHIFQAHYLTADKWQSPVKNRLMEKPDNSDFDIMGTMSSAQDERHKTKAMNRLVVI